MFNLEASLSNFQKLSTTVPLNFYTEKKNVMSFPSALYKKKQLNVLCRKNETLTLSPWFLLSAFPRGSSLLQTPPRSVFWQRQWKRAVPLLVISAEGPPALQQRQQPNGQSVPAARFSRQLGSSSAAAPTGPGPPAQGPPAGSPAAWLLSITPQPVTPAAPADAQRQPQWQRGGPDHGEGGEEPVTLPQPAGGGGPTGSAPAQVSVCSTRARGEQCVCVCVCVWVFLHIISLLSCFRTFQICRMELWAVTCKMLSSSRHERSETRPPRRFGQIWGFG